MQFEDVCERLVLALLVVLLLVVWVVWVCMQGWELCELEYEALVGVGVVEVRACVGWQLKCERGRRVLLLG